MTENHSTQSNFRIRKFQQGDEAALGEICCKTGDSGKDATGKLSNDDLWGHVWVLPYVDHDPSLAFVVETTSSSTTKSRVVGYCVATADTIDFNKWYHSDYWSAHRGQFVADAYQDGRHSKPQRELDIIAYAETIGTQTGKPDTTGPEEKYPAHLHINLLPEAQGGGLGRKLIECIVEELKRRGSPGVHLGASAKNEKACGFYRKIGFEELPEKGDTRTFVINF